MQFERCHFESGYENSNIKAFATTGRINTDHYIDLHDSSFVSNNK